MDDGDYILSSYTPRQPFKHSEESKLLMSEALQGKVPWNKGVTGYTTSFKGRKLTDEQRAKVKAARGTDGRRFGPHAEETKQKCRDNHPGCRQIVLNDVSYHSVSAAARALGVSTKTIRNRLK